MPVSFLCCGMYSSSCTPNAMVSMRKNNLKNIVEYQGFGKLLLYSDVGGFYLKLIKLTLHIHHRSVQKL